MIWVLVSIIGFIAEITTLSLVSIWFSVGALMGLVLKYMGFLFIGQIAGFTIISILTFLIFRPALVKHIKLPKIKTNMDRNIGKTGEVIKDIKPLSFGHVKINGQIWTAKSIDEATIQKGTIVEVVDIEGVKLIVVDKERGILEWDGSF